MTVLESQLAKQQDLGVDWRTPGGFTKEEERAVREWYSAYHGEGDLNGAPFVSFWLDNNQEIFKRWRRMAESALRGGFPAGVPPALFLHTYTVMGWEAGALYETIAALKWGITKRQVLEIIALAFIHAGPFGISKIAPSCDAYLRKWNGQTDVDAVAWPNRWGPDREAFKSGLDFLETGMSANEIKQLSAWYIENQGEVPDYVNFLAKWKPELLKAFRQRYESAIVTLPKQVVPLLTFHTAAMQGKVGAMRRSAYQARRYGVLRSEITSALSLAALYAGDLGLECMTRVMEPLLAHWPDE